MFVCGRNWGPGGKCRRKAELLLCWLPYHRARVNGDCGRDKSVGTQPVRCASYAKKQSKAPKDESKALAWPASIGIH